MLLYDAPLSGNCYKVRLLLAHLGLPYERREVEVVDRSASRDMLDGLNPVRLVPTLVLDDGRVLAESNAILWYLAQGTEYLSDDTFTCAKALQWLFFEQYSHEPYIAILRYIVSLAPQEVPEGELAHRRKRGYKALDAMEAELTGSRFLVAERFSIADIALYAYTHVAHEGGFDLSSYPAIRSWLERVAAVEGHVAIAD
ncbi:MAG: glutathione S-transferase family protein [Solirubrobacteraceae bacterium]